MELNELVLPQHTNAMGTCFGGTVMAWVDVAAATCAMKHARKQCVTAAIDAMQFLAPVKLGWVVCLKARVNYTHNTSAEVGVKVTAENPLTGEVFNTARAYLTMVALDSAGRPTKFPPVQAETVEDKRRYDRAKVRRDDRLARREKEKAHD